MKGFDTTIGYTRWGNKPAQEDAVVRFPPSCPLLIFHPLITFPTINIVAQQIVATLRAAGAIIIAKTNVPQTLLAFESCNPLWGRTCNPWSAAHTAGGSSGGEGAVLAVDGAALGVGTDVGGSIRIPSGYCGIYGLKPGQGRVSYDGAIGTSVLSHVSLGFSSWRLGPNPGFEAVRATAGPMGRSVADLERMARVLFGERGSGHAYFPAPVPYRDVTLPEKLRFGYYLNGVSVPPHSLWARRLTGCAIKRVWSGALLHVTGRY